MNAVRMRVKAYVDAQARADHATAYGIALLSTIMLFLVIYRIVPNARQRFLDVWPGTLVASLLFVLLTQAFPIYIQMVGGVNRYGQVLGLISLIVVALFVLAHIILFGAYINASWQRRRARKAQAARVVVAEAPADDLQDQRFPRSKREELRWEEQAAPFFYGGERPAQEFLQVPPAVRRRDGIPAIGEKLPVDLQTEGEGLGHDGQQIARN